MNDDDVLNFANILETVDYNHKQDTNSVRSKYIKNNLQNRVDKILKPPSSSTTYQIEPPTDEESDLEGSGVTKIIIPFLLY